jgi:hypothetical protein
MALTDEQKAELEKFPEALRVLLKDEIQAGNKIIEITHGPPAAPIGANAVLQNRVSQRERSFAPGLRYRPCKGSEFSGWFTDETEHFYVLEPPDPEAGAYPDTNAIRRGANFQSASDRPGATRSVDSALESPKRVERQGSSSYDGEASKSNQDSAAQAADTTGGVSVFQQFLQSMQLDYYRWREGESYDLALLDAASLTDRKQIEDYLVHRPVNDWRDVEALAELDSIAAEGVLRNVLQTGTSEMKIWVLNYAPHLIDENRKLEVVLEGIESTEIYHGLSRVLEAVAEFHPPQIVDALLKATLTRSGDVASHLAAMLFYIHGKSQQPFDWDHRPLFLRFSTESITGRQEAFRELCSAIGIDASAYL